MRRLLTVVISLSLAGLACSALPLPGAEPTGAASSLETAVAATLTALATTGPATGTAEPATATPITEATPTVAAALTCAVAYADAANLFCLSADGTPQRLAAAPSGQQIWDPAISPDGQLVGYLVGAPGAPSELWVVGADPALNPPRALVAPAQVPSANPDNIWYPRRFAWQPATRTLFFDTGWQPVGGIQGPGEYINNDLWRADADSPEVALVLGEGLGGNWAVAPNGNFVAFSYPEGLGLVNADGTNLRREVVTFPAILTYSEYAFKPDIQWHADSLAFSVAVPSRDPMAPDAHITLYRVGTDGIAAPLGTLPGNFVFGGLSRPAFSPSGRFLAYSQLQPGSSQTEDIHLVDLDAAPPADTIVDAKDVPSGWGWSPNGDHYLYASTPGGVPGSGYDLGLEGPIRPWAPGLTAILDLEWADPATFYFIGQINSAGWSLYRVALGSEPVLVASGLSQTAGLDVRR